MLEAIFQTSLLNHFFFFNFFALLLNIIQKKVIFCQFSNLRIEIYQIFYLPAFVIICTDLQLFDDSLFSFLPTALSSNFFASVCLPIFLKAVFVVIKNFIKQLIPFSLSLVLCMRFV